MFGNLVHPSDIRRIGRALRRRIQSVRQAPTGSLPLSGGRGRTWQRLHSRSAPKKAAPSEVPAARSGAVRGAGTRAMVPLVSTVRRLERAAVALWLWGNRFECPCCGKRFRGFRPGGPERRPNARCPGCGSLERHRLVWMWVQRATDLLTARRRVLVVAPEAFLQDALRALPGLEYLSVDLESPLAMRRMELTHLELPDASFDAVFCSHVLEHIRDDRAAMRELLRVLAPGGWAVLQTPLDPSRERTFEDPTLTTPADRRHAFGQADHVRIYGRDFFDRLRECGWAIERLALARTLGDATARRYGLDLDEEVLIGRRAADLG